MIELIIKSYFVLFVSVGGAAALIFILGVYWIFKSQFSQRKATIVKRVEQPSVPAVSKVEPIQNQATVVEPVVKKEEFALDFSAIAGDDVQATQLDLARAYIETGKKQLAKTILQQVLEQGSAIQKQEAQRLLNVIYI